MLLMAVQISSGALLTFSEFANFSFVSPRVVVLFSGTRLVLFCLVLFYFVCLFAAGSKVAVSYWTIHILDYLCQGDFFGGNSIILAPFLLRKF